MVEMVLLRILISETSDQQYVFLKEKEGERSFPIVIGFAEASAIDRAVKRERYPRPLTHDLLAGVVEALGSRLDRVEVTSVRDGTFYALLHLRASDGKEVAVDARPSDALALAAASNAPIFVAEQVLEDSTPS